jgi:hypothetical protein
MKKDISLALDMARRVGSTNVLGSVGLQIYKEASEENWDNPLNRGYVHRSLILVLMISLPVLVSTQVPEHRRGTKRTFYLNQRQVFLLERMIVKPRDKSIR